MVGGGKSKKKQESKPSKIFLNEVVSSLFSVIAIS